MFFHLFHPALTIYFILLKIKVLIDFLSNPDPKRVFYLAVCILGAAARTGRAVKHTDTDTVGPHPVRLELWLLGKSLSIHPMTRHKLFLFQMNKIQYDLRDKIEVNGQSFHAANCFTNSAI